MKYRVIVDGRLLDDPIRILDAGSSGAKAGDKVVVDIVSFPEPGDDDLPEGVITEVLGEAGLPDVETAAVMAAFGLAGDFPEAVMQEARDAAGKMDVKKLPKDRADLREAVHHHDRPAGREGLRRRDLAGAARPREGGRQRRVGAGRPHRRRRRLRHPRLGPGRRGLRPREQHVPAQEGGADAARGALQRGLQPAAQRGPLREELLHPARRRGAGGLGPLHQERDQEQPADDLPGGAGPHRRRRQGSPQALPHRLRRRGEVPQEADRSLQGHGRTGPGHPEPAAWARA